jgi:hypothetical protein
LKISNLFSTEYFCGTSFQISKQISGYNPISLNCVTPEQRGVESYTIWLKITDNLQIVVEWALTSDSALHFLTIELCLANNACTRSITHFMHMGTSK